MMEGVSMKRVLMVLFFIMGMLVFGEKDEIVVNFDHEPGLLDPQLSTDFVVMQLSSFLFEGLTRQDETDRMKQVKPFRELQKNGKLLKKDMCGLFI